MYPNSFFRAVSIVFLALAFSVGTRTQTIKVTLLGTGAPPPVMDRFGPSILVEAGSQKLIFDVGRGAIQRLTQIQVRPKDINGVFLTHLHSDHTVGFPDLWLTGWLNGRRDKPMKVWGPKGTERMMSFLEQAFDYDIKIRLYDDRASPDGVILDAKDIVEGVAYEKDGVRVTAFEVDHAPIKPAFGYRIDFAGRSVVLSGDTRPSENLIKFAKGTDLLIHEVASREALIRAKQPAEHLDTIMNHHTSPEQAGEVFAKVKPKLAVYSHIVPASGTEQDLIPPARKTYSGPLELGEDLMVIIVGEKIEIRRSKLSP
jgi:ribonuclease Z